MKSVFNVLSIALLGLSVSFCSMFSKTEEKPEQEPVHYKEYSSSGVYKDIEAAVIDDGRSISSEEYSDDDYGDVASEEPAEDGEAYAGTVMDDEEDNEEPASMGADPLPVETLESETEQPVEKVAKKMPPFKNGMYRVSVNCTMRSKPSTKSAKAGTVNKGKKLWMEAHNTNWVKVFKKSGTVYINRLCL